MSCINCNGREVTRDGDQFTCARCGFTWDVAHEQANAAYLRTQGREPAKTMAELAEIEAASGLEAALGLEPIGVHLREPRVPTGDERALIEAVLDSKTVPDLEEIAEQAGVDLDEARLKADKIAALIDSGRVYLAEDQETVIVVGEDE